MPGNLSSMACHVQGAQVLIQEKDIAAEKERRRPVDQVDQQLAVQRE